MKRSPALLIALACLFVAGAATAAYLLVGGSKAVTLPDEAVTEQTVIALVIDMQQVDDTARATIKKSVEDMFGFFGEFAGGAMATSDMAEATDAIDRFFSVIDDHKIKAFAVTMEMDVREMIRNGGEAPVKPPVMTILVKAGAEPDMAQLITDITGQEMPQEAAQSMVVKPLSGDWYALGATEGPGMMRIPSGDGDSATAAKFNKALSLSAGGMIQMAMVIPEDAANALAGKLAADMPEDATESIREAVRSFSDMQMVSFALDVNEGVGIREYLVYENSDAAKRMVDAFKDMKSDLPAMFEAMSDMPPYNEADEQELQPLIDSMTELMELVEVSRSGATVEIVLSEDYFEKMIDLMVNMMKPSLSGAPDAARARMAEAQAARRGQADAAIVDDDAAQDHASELLAQPPADSTPGP